MLIFDTEPLVAFFTGETEAPAVRRLLEHVQQGGEDGALSSVSLAELYYILHRRSKAGATAATTALRDWGLAFHPADNLWREAGTLKSTHAIPLADAYAAATALALRAELVCGRDSHFDKIAGLRLRRV